ncbi:hypothetical protein [Pseudomonas sp. RT6P73]
MGTVLSRARQLLFTLLLVSSASHAITGPEVAQLLNNRYKNTTAECAGDNPAYFCSGVLLLPSQGPDEFWKPDAPSTTLGARSVAYVRADLDTRTLPQKNGAVFSDQFTAIGWGKPLDVLCAYPFEFPVQGTRPGFGCGWTAATKNTQDVSSCTALGVTDAPGWLTHFGQQGNQPARQCSLSSRDPAQFMASLIAHQSLAADWSARPTLLQVKNGDAQVPRQLPLQGLFYDVTQTGSLLGAQKDQRDYFSATGDWLPILRMDLTQAPDAVFGFNQQDQLYIGYQVASGLNARFADTSSTCQNEQSADHCNGVLIRGANASASFHAWNPSENSEGRNGVSFSYVRADVGTTKLAGTQGFIFKESFAPASHPVTLRCSYPANAGTASIPDSCRASCESLGVTTVAAWQAKYANNPGSSCAFGMGQAAFQLSIAVRSHFTNPAAKLNWNEIIIAAWPQDIPKQLPLEAFFYLSENAAGLANAQFIQRDYFQQTARFLPVVRVNLAAADGRPFTFETQDQTVQGTSMAMLVNAITPRSPRSLQDE